MSCTQCMAPYTAFRKEQGCSNCGFGFCASCLNHKAVVPHLTDVPLSVCPPCYRKLTQQHAEVKFGSLRDGTERMDGRWWGRDELPPPSMRQNCQPPQRHLHTKSATALSSQPPPYSEVCGISDDQIAQRLDKLKSDRTILEGRGVKKMATVTEIEQRLANLRGVPVEEIRNPSLMFARKRSEIRGETVEDLIEKAFAESRIEKKWDPMKQLERRYNEYHNIEVGNDDSEEEEEGRELTAIKAKKFCVKSASNSAGMKDDIIMDEDTIRGMKDIAKTLGLAEQESIDAGACAAASDRSMKEEMKKIAKLTRQRSLKNEKINAELGKFWERSFEKYGNGDDNEDNDIDEEELQKIIREAQQSENEVKENIKESKKIRKKGNLFSRLFRRSSTD